MDQTEQILLQAIQKSLWNIDISFPDDTDWNAVLKEAELQTVLGIVIGVVPQEVQNEWVSRTYLETARFVRILYYQEQLYKLLKDNDVPLVILKGTAAAIYYPHPEQRTMGDIDYLVPPEHYDRAKELLVQNGYRVEDDPREYRHLHVHKEDILFEQHRCFSGGGVDVERFVADGMAQIETGVICGTEFPMLPKLANGLVLLGHVAQHLLSGLGLRQVIDWMMYVSRELDDTFWKQSFEAAAQEVGLDTAAAVTTRMCQLYLGLSEDIQWCKGADTELCRELMESLLSSGNFGRKREQGYSVEKVTSHILNVGLFRYLQTAGEYNWKAYHAHEWLRPFAWAYQIVRYVRKGMQAKRGGRLKEDIVRGRQRSKLLEKLKIGEKQHSS